MSSLPSLATVVADDEVVRLRHAATHDALTGLPNRALLLERLNDAVSGRAEPSHGVAVLFVDLDHFKRINDSLGHAAGDIVLCAVARRILDCVGPNDSVGRVGGDEIVVVHMPDAVPFPGGVEASARALGERIIAALETPIMAAGRELVMSASVGLASSTTGGTSPSQLLRNADTALYSAKELGRGRVEVFTPQLYERAASRVQIESDLRIALREDQLFLEYQPQVNLAGGTLVGVEALVRWNHPARGRLSPDEFVEVAEETGLIVDVGRFVLRTACAHFAEWHATCATPPATLSVNVAPRQLADPGFVDDVVTILASTGVAAEQLCLELTESAVMDSSTDLLVTLDRLRRLGVYLAIDDFGRGHSSLERLRALPVEVLKIDRAFIDGLGEEPGDTAIVTSIVNLAFAMGLHVIAEGVETASQAALLRDLRCPAAQGFFFARPVGADEITELSGQSFITPKSGIRYELPRAPSRPDAFRRARRFLTDEFLDQIGVPMAGEWPEAPR